MHRGAYDYLVKTHRSGTYCPVHRKKRLNGGALVAGRAGGPAGVTKGVLPQAFSHMVDPIPSNVGDYRVCADHGQRRQAHINYRRKPVPVRS